MNSNFLLKGPAHLHNKKEKRLYFLLLFFFFSLYVPGISWLYNAAMWLMVAYSLFVNTPAEKWRILKSRPSILLMMLFFLLNCTSALLSADIQEGVSWVGIRISLFAFPLALGTIVISRALKEQVLFGFVAATCCAAALCLVNGAIRVAAHADWSLLYNDNLSAIAGRQSIYLAMLINVALVSFAYLKITGSPVVRSFAWWPVLILLLPVHFLLASRIAIMVLYSLILAFGLYGLFLAGKRRQGMLVVATLFIAGILLFLLFPKTLNRFKELSYTDFNYSSTGRESHFNVALTPDQWNGANIRMAVWTCAWEVTRHHVLLGTGLGDKMTILKKQYAQKGFAFGIQTNRNVHNTYLDVWMSLGLLGLLLFLTGFFALPAAHCIQARDWFGLIVLSCLFISLFTETYLDRTIGNTLLSFFCALIASYQKNSAVSTVH